MTKRLGCIFEQEFFAQALRKGLEVFCPLGEHLPQDCIVVNSAGRKFNVQIKGTEKARLGDGTKTIKRYRFSCSTGRTVKKPLDCTKVDVVAVYCDDIDVWYLIPCMAIDNAVTISVYPHVEGSKAKHERFRENWEIFKTAWVIYPPPCYNCNWCIISMCRLTQECEL